MPPILRNALLLCLGTPAALCAILWVRSTDNVEFQNILPFQLTFSQNHCPPHISIVDIDLNVPQGGISYADLINSPRTLEAMATLGHEPEELDDISYADIREMLIKRERKQSVPKMVVDLRFDNEQKKRHDKKQAIVLVSDIFSCELF